MKQKVFFILALLLGILVPQGAKAYDFSAVAPTGQTLYYYTSGNNVIVVCPSYSNGYSGYTQPSGDLEIPSSVTHNGTTYSVISIGQSAFYCCSGLTSVTIPNSVTSIGPYAFNNCSGLTSVTIPYSVTSIGNSAFYSVGTVLYSRELTGCPWGASACNGFIADSLIYIDATKTEVVSYVRGLSNANIPNSVTSIGNYAFHGCSSLTSVTIPNSVTGIGTGAFGDCTGLTSVTIGNSVTSIGNYAFKNCSGVTGALAIPNSVTSIGQSAFYGCSGLTSVTIPNSVTSIGQNAFNNCSGLTSVTIGNSVDTIQAGAFSNCTGMQVLHLGSALQYVGAAAFYNCDHLDTIYSLNPTPATVAYSNAFENVWKGLPLIVPTGSRNAYATAYGWRDFTNIQEFSTAPITTTYTVTATANDATMGSVTGGGSYTSGATATLTATANSGYHFVQWNDGNTANPRTVTVTANATYTAIFAPDQSQYTVTVAANDATMGYVTGGGTYTSGATATLTATANSGYHFVQWNDGNTANPRTVTVTANATYTAIFAPDQSQYTVTATANDATMGYVTGGGSYPSGATATLTATANAGYHFVQWNDGNTTNPRTVTVTANATYTAIFAPDQGQTQFTVTATANDATMGYVTGGGSYTSGATATLTATANTGYHFVQWNDGNTTNPRTVTVTANATYMALFGADQSDAPQIAYVGVDANGHNSVCWMPRTGSAAVSYRVYREGTQAGVYEQVGIVQSTGAAAYTWSDDQSNPAVRAYSYRLTEVAADGTESAQSAPHTTMHLQINQGQGGAWNLTWTPYAGFAYSTYRIYRGATAASLSLLTTLPASSTTYSDLTAGGVNYYYQIEVVQLGSSKSVTGNSRSNIANSDPEPQHYTLTVLSADITRGTVTGGGSYEQGETATLEAQAAEGFVFLQWQDGNTTNPRTITVTADVTYMAYFTQTEGIADAEGSNVTITARNGRILVSGAEGRQVTLSDALGRILYCGTATESLTVEAPATGIYLLQVEGHPAHRISVVR